jgi:plastocyanin
MEETAVTSRRGLMRGVAGAVGAGAAAGAGTAVGSGEARGQATRTIDMTDALVFDPSAATIPPGTTVVWDNVGSVGHSVTAYEDDIPEEAEFFASGGFDGESAARSSYSAGDPDSGDVAGGETFEHTFEVVGQYDYFCIPHESAGMVASITVEEGAPVEPTPEPGPSLPEVPDSARTLTIAVLTAMLSTLGLAYFFMKYGGDYDVEEE